jgi:hypothetical protein
VENDIVDELAPSHGWCALHHAARNGDVSLVRYLLDRRGGVDVKTQLGHGKAGDALRALEGWTPLCLAAANGHHVVVQVRMYVRVHCSGSQHAAHNRSSLTITRIRTRRRPMDSPRYCSRRKDSFRMYCACCLPSVTSSCNLQAWRVGSLMELCLRLFTLQHSSETPQC